MSTEYAYTTSAPEIVAAYRQALADAEAQGRKICEGLAAIGAGPEIYVRSSGFPGSKTQFTEIVPVGDAVPEGWRPMKRSGRLEPRRGKPGEKARQWLAEHQPVDVRYVMEQHGLPRASWIAKGNDFNYSITVPHFFEHGGSMWARYQGEPGTSGSGFDNDKCTWDPCKLSAFYAAYEAFQAAEDGA